MKQLTLKLKLESIEGKIGGRREYVVKTWMVFPEGSEGHLASFMSSQAIIVGSSL